MGVIRQPIQKKVVIAHINSAEQSTAPPTDDESISSGHVTPVPQPTNRSISSAVADVLKRRGLVCSRMSTKQGLGRRTQQRSDNEKLLMAMYGVDCEDGGDIPQASRSYFQDLLHCDNEELLEQFINNEEPRFYSKQKINRRMRPETDEDFDPESSFLKIGSGMRQALKKHLPLGMLEGLENKVTETFLTNPNTEYVADSLTSFERLLLHAICSYNSLNSHSFDFGGKRLVRVENPFGKFFERDPSLCQYLGIRGNGDL